MLYGIYQSAAGMQVNQYRQKVLANNLANIDTAGFKQDLAVVRERQVASREQLGNRSWSNPIADRMTGGTLVAPTVTRFDKGMIQSTGHPLDVALDDRGFFVVEDGNETRYTRDGRFALNASRELVLATNGKRVLSDAGTPIVVPEGLEAKMRIEAGGRVRAGRKVIGQLGIVDFEDRNVLRKTGGNLFRAVGGEPTSVPGRLRIGAIEASTVDPTREMVTMIEVARAYEMNATLLGLADSSLGRAVNDIARLR